MGHGISELLKLKISWEGKPPDPLAPLVFDKVSILCVLHENECYAPNLMQFFHLRWGSIFTVGHVARNLKTLGLSLVWKSCGMHPAK